jgi:SAM-dependent methyltransferase
VSAAFKDHFSDRAARYATYRPQYPAALAAYLTSIAPATETAWDVGCGSGQFSTQLGDRFARVIAADASADQIALAQPHSHVEYVIATAEQPPIEDHSIDLITAAQAAHWFDLPSFYREVERVARPNAAIALFTYGITVVDGPPREIVDHLYYDALETWWPPERRHTENGYAHFEFPFAEITPPSIEMAVDWTVDELIGYIGTWSAVRALERAEGDATTQKVAEDLRATWGDVARRRVSWPLGMRVGRVAPT